MLRVQKQFSYDYYCLNNYIDYFDLQHRSKYDWKEYLPVIGDVDRLSIYAVRGSEYHIPVETCYMFELNVPNCTLNERAFSNYNTVFSGDGYSDLVSMGMNGYTQLELNPLFLENAFDVKLRYSTKRSDAYSTDILHESAYLKDYTVSDTNSDLNVSVNKEDTPSKPVIVKSASVKDIMRKHRRRRNTV